MNRRNCQKKNKHQETQNQNALQSKSGKEKNRFFFFPLKKRENFSIPKKSSKWGPHVGGDQALSEQVYGQFPGQVYP